jgi:hypothetical protein
MGTPLETEPTEPAFVWVAAVSVAVFVSLGAAVGWVIGLLNSLWPHWAGH